jgi:hypothetical protein
MRGPRHSFRAAPRTRHGSVVLLPTVKEVRSSRRSPVGAAAKHPASKRRHPSGSSEQFRTGRADGQATPRHSTRRHSRSTPAGSSRKKKTTDIAAEAERAQPLEVIKFTVTAHRAVTVRPLERYASSAATTTRGRVEQVAGGRGGPVDVDPGYGGRLSSQNVPARRAARSGSPPRRRPSTCRSCSATTAPRPGGARRRPGPVSVPRPPPLPRRTGCASPRCASGHCERRTRSAPPAGPEGR